MFIYLKNKVLRTCQCLKYVDHKIDILLNNFASQAGKHWFDKETFQSIMRIRGLESAAKHKFAEAFYARKIVL